MNFILNHSLQHKTHHPSRPNKRKMSGSPPDLPQLDPSPTLPKSVRPYRPYTSFLGTPFLHRLRIKKPVGRGMLLLLFVCSLQKEKSHSYDFFLDVSW